MQGHSLYAPSAHQALPPTLGPQPQKCPDPTFGCWLAACFSNTCKMYNFPVCVRGGPSLLWVSGSDRRIYAVCPCETLENSRKTKSTTFSVNVIAHVRSDEGICSNISWTLVGNRVPAHRIDMRKMESTKYGLMQAGGYIYVCV